MVEMDRSHFSIFGIPVRVQWTFAITLLFNPFVGGAEDSRTKALSYGIWGGIVFVSVLLHELGHAFIGRIFGLHPSIQLYAFGGQTSWVGGRNIGDGKSLLISLAGPFVSLALAAIGFVVAIRFPTDAVETFVIAN